MILRILFFYYQFPLQAVRPGKTKSKAHIIIGEPYCQCIILRGINAIGFPPYSYRHIIYTG